MAENSKKRARKSKLVPRDCQDFEEVKYIVEPEEVPEQISAEQSELLPKIKMEIDKEDYIENSPIHNFSINVEVEVEACEIDDYREDVEVKQEPEESPPLPLLVTERTLVLNDILHALKKLPNTSTVDKQLQAELLNYLGKKPMPVKLDFHEKLIQTAAQSWRSWYFQSKYRESFLMYKCYVCDVGWWDLQPFREHIRQHGESIHVDVEIANNECNLIAFYGESVVMKDLDIKGDCARCLRSAEFHWVSKRPSMFYICDCGERFQTCGGLLTHEGLCQKFIKKCMEGRIWREDSWKCLVCDLKCLTEERHHKHMTMRHRVKSDEIVSTLPLKTCAQCGGEFFIHPVHNCPMKSDTVKCKYCWQLFQSNYLAQLHDKYTKSNASCRVCGMRFLRQCMEGPHLLNHTENYIPVYKCMACADFVVFTSKKCCLQHQATHTWKKPKIKKNEMIVLPRICMSVDWESVEDSIETTDTPISETEVQIKKNSATKSRKGADNPKITLSRTLQQTVDEECSNIEQLHQAFDELDQIQIKNEHNEFVEYTADVEEIHFADAVDIKAENKDDEDDYMATLSNVFRASKNIANTKPYAINEELIIKDEIIEEDYEDDIIILNPDAEEMEDVVIIDESDEPKTTSEPQKGKSKKRAHSFPRKKMYSCWKCDFQGHHREYSEHLKYICPGRKRKYRKPGFNIIDKSTISWGNLLCTKCNVGYARLAEYISHFKNHGLEYSACPVCQLVFEKPYKAVPHLLSHIRFMFVKLQLIKGSKCITSKMNGLYQCKICTDKVAYSEFFQHWEAHLDLQAKRPSGELRVETDANKLVGETRLSPESLKILVDQLQLSTYENPRALIKACGVCKRSFERKNDCKRHLIEHLLIDAYANRPRHDGLLCQICPVNQVFHKAETYKHHMRSHGSLPIFKCELCVKTFSDSSNFAKHKKVHNLRVVVCDICGKKFNTKKHLVKHIEEHKTMQPVSCTLCDRVYQSVSAFNKHVQAMHKLGPKFQCLTCRRRFVRLKDKWEHMWEAHKQRNVKADCPVCNQSFRKIQDVRNHVKAEHEKGKGAIKSFRTYKGPKTRAAQKPPTTEPPTTMVEDQRIVVPGEQAQRMATLESLTMVMPNETVERMGMVEGTKVREGMVGRPIMLEPPPLVKIPKKPARPILHLHNIDISHFKPMRIINVSKLSDSNSGSM